MERDATTLQEVVIGYQTVPRSKVSGFSVQRSALSIYIVAGNDCIEKYMWKLPF